MLIRKINCLLKLKICNSDNVIYIISTSPLIATLMNGIARQKLLIHGTCSKSGKVKPNLFRA